MPEPGKSFSDCRNRLLLGGYSGSPNVPSIAINLTHSALWRYTLFLIIYYQAGVRRIQVKSRALTLVLTGLVFAACGDSPTSVQETIPVPRLSDLALAVDDPVLVGAGDMHADCAGTTEDSTAALVGAIAGTVFTLGDNTETGSTADFNNCYELNWGQHKARTRPSPGDNDYGTPGATPYYTYFGASAGAAGQGYYSYDISVGGSAWHVISLNSNIAAGTTSAQYQWLEADLAANPTACAVAYWHEPRYSSTRLTLSSKMKGIWNLLDDEGVDIVMNGHSHVYERFAAQDENGIAKANGIRQFTVGTGGKALSSFVTVLPNSEERESGSFGVLKLTLHEGSYDWQFVAVAPSTYADGGTASCVDVPGPPVASAGGPYSGKEGSSIAFNGSGSSDPEGGTLTYDWGFGDGTAGTGATPSHAYADNGVYDVTLITTDESALADTAFTTATVSSVAPTATFNAPAWAPPSTDYPLSLTDPADPSSADVAAGFSYAFDCGDGIFGAWGAPSSVTCPGVGTEGPLTVKGKLRDKDLAEREYTATVQISTSPPNQAPAAAAGGPYTGSEGTAINMTGAGSSDPESQTLTYDWNFGDGATATGTDPAVSHTYADNGTFVVTLIVTDPGALADTASASATVSNVKPSATFVAPSTIPVSTGFTISLTNPNDPSSADVLAGFTYRFDCGSGFGPWGTATSRNCTSRSTAGSTVVRGRIRDKNLAYRTYMKTVQVTP